MVVRSLYAAAIALTAFGLYGCGDTSHGRGNAMIGDSCTSTSECSPGLECSVGGACVPATTGSDATGGDGTGGGADAPGGGGDGFVGNVPDFAGGPGDFVACAAVDINFDPVIPTVILLVDRSGSMTADFGNTDRWGAVQDVLFDPTDGVVTRYEDAVRFGIVTYNSEGGFDGGECPILREEAPDLSNGTDMANVLASDGPSGDTPTGESITGVVPLFDTVASRAPKVLLLATDGEPDTCEVPNPQEGQDESVAAAQAAHQSGVETYVLSVGTDVGAAHLQDMANAGRGVEVGGAENMPYWTASDPVAMGDAVAEIITGSRPCIFAVQGATIDESRAGLGVVELNDQRLDEGGNNGWTLHSDGTCFSAVGQCIQLHGDACREVQTDPDPSLQARFPCEAVVGG